MFKTGLSVLTVVLLLYLAACVLLYLNQRSFIYFPTPQTGHPQVPLPVLDLRISNDGEALQVWQLNPGRATAILYFGGNAENVVANLPEFARLFPEHTVYLVSYRGYGGSTGSPSEAALVSDAQAIYDHVSPSHDSIHAIGRSLGSGVAVSLASGREIERLVLVTPYDSIATIAAGAMPLFPVRLLLQDRFDSASRVGKLRNPTLLVMAEHDRVIPRGSSQALLAQFPRDLARAVVVPGTDHNDIGLSVVYQETLARFLAIERPAG